MRKPQDRSDHHARWPYEKLGDICRTQHGGTPSKSIADYWKGEVPWVSPKDMRGLRISDSIDHITEEALRQTATGVTEEGSILVVVRSGILARTIPCAISKNRLAFNQDIKALVPSPDRLKADYLLYWLKSNEAMILREGVKRGATVHSIKSGFLENLQIPLPPLSEQKRIVAILNEQMAAVEKARIAAEAQLEAARALPAAYLREVFPKGEPGKAPLPDGWRWVRLGELCHLVNGNAYKESDWSDQGTPIIRIQNLNDEQKLFNYWQGPTTDRVIVNDGDVLLAWSGTPGTSFGAHRWRRGRAVLNQHIFRVDYMRDAVLPDWLVHSVNNALSEMIAKSHGAVGLRHITRPETEALWLPLAPLKDQEELMRSLSDKLSRTANLEAHLEAQSTSITHLPSSLLRRAFNGEL